MKRLRHRECDSPLWHVAIISLVVTGALARAVDELPCDWPSECPSPNGECAAGTFVFHCVPEDECSSPHPCDGAVCTGYPNAVCVLDLCAGCSHEFIDPETCEPVQCTTEIIVDEPGCFTEEYGNIIAEGIDIAQNIFFTFQWKLPNEPWEQDVNLLTLYDYNFIPYIRISVVEHVTSWVFSYSSDNECRNGDTSTFADDVIDVAIYLGPELFAVSIGGEEACSQVRSYSATHNLRFWSLLIGPLVGEVCNIRITDLHDELPCDWPSECPTPNGLCAGGTLHCVPEYECLSPHPCDGAVCTGHPNAVCVLDLCGGCNHEFIDPETCEPVQCTTEIVLDEPGCFAEVNPFVVADDINIAQNIVFTFQYKPPVEMFKANLLTLFDSDDIPYIEANVYQFGPNWVFAYSFNNGCTHDDWRSFKVGVIDVEIFLGPELFAVSLGGEEVCSRVRSYSAIHNLTRSRLQIGGTIYEEPGSERLIGEVCNIRIANLHELPCDFRSECPTPNGQCAAGTFDCVPEDECSSPHPCDGAVCEGHPNYVCVLDLCGGCNHEFIDPETCEPVQCGTEIIVDEPGCFTEGYGRVIAEGFDMAQNIFFTFQWKLPNEPWEQDVNLLTLLDYNYLPYISISVVEHVTSWVFAYSFDNGCRNGDAWTFEYDVIDVAIYLGPELFSVSIGGEEACSRVRSYSGTHQLGFWRLLIGGLADGEFSYGPLVGEVCNIRITNLLPPSTTMQPTLMPSIPVPSSPPSTIPVPSSPPSTIPVPSAPPVTHATHMPSDNSLFGSLSPGERMAVYFSIAGGGILCVYLSIMVYKPTTARPSSVTATTSPVEPNFELNQWFDGKDEQCRGSYHDGTPNSPAYGVGEIEITTWSVPTDGDTEESEVVDSLHREVDTLSEKSGGSFGDPKRELAIQVSEAQLQVSNNGSETEEKRDEEISLGETAEVDPLPELKLETKISEAQLPASNNGSETEEKRDEQISLGETAEVDPLLELKLETKLKSALSPSPASPILAPPSEEKFDLQALRCPITLELMSEPVILFADGHTYEKQALDQWFATGRRLSPITGGQIASTNYTTNWTVKSLVEEYLTKYPQFQKQAKPADAEQRSLEAAVALRERDMEAAARKISVLRRDNDDLKVSSNKHDEILAAISRVSTQVDEGFSNLSTQLAELGLEVFSRLPGGNVPRLFVVLPDEWFSGAPRRFGKVKSVFKSKWRVLPLCEGNDCFSECHINTYHEGYTISITRQWLQKSMPVIKVALKVVCVATQVASSGAVNLGPLARLLPSDTEDIVKLSDTLAASVGMAQDRLDPKSITSLLEDESLMREGSAELATILAKEEDKTGGLQQMYNASNQVVWVCPDHTHGLVGPNRK